MVNVSNRQLYGGLCVYVCAIISRYKYFHQGQTMTITSLTKFMSYFHRTDTIDVNILKGTGTGKINRKEFEPFNIIYVIEHSRNLIFNNDCV